MVKETSFAKRKCARPDFGWGVHRAAVLEPLRGTETYEVRIGEFEGNCGGESCGWRSKTPTKGSYKEVRIVQKGSYQFPQGERIPVWEESSENKSRIAWPLNIEF